MAELASSENSITLGAEAILNDMIAAALDDLISQGPLKDRLAEQKKS